MTPDRLQWAHLGTTLAAAAGVLACGMVLGLTWGQAAVVSGCPGLPGAPCTQTVHTLADRIWLMTLVALPALVAGLGGRLYLRRVIA